LGAGNARALFTVIVYVYGPTVVFVELSFTLTLNETVAAEAGVPLTVSVEPLSAALSPSDKAVRSSYSSAAAGHGDRSAINRAYVRGAQDAGFGVGSVSEL